MMPWVFMPDLKVESILAVWIRFGYFYEAANKSSLVNIFPTRNIANHFSILLYIATLWVPKLCYFTAKSSYLQLRM